MSIESKVGGLGGIFQLHVSVTLKIGTSKRQEGLHDFERMQVPT